MAPCQERKRLRKAFSETPTTLWGFTNGLHWDGLDQPGQSFAAPRGHGGLPFAGSLALAAPRWAGLGWASLGFAGLPPATPAGAYHGRLEREKVRADADVAANPGSASRCLSARASMSGPMSG
jgi:hypothetical protein